MDEQKPPVPQQPFQGTNPPQPVAQAPQQQPFAQQPPAQAYGTAQPFAGAPVSPQQPQAATGSDPGNTLAIISLVCALFAPIVGLLLAIMAKSRSKKAGFKNTLAFVSIIINSALLVLTALAMIGICMAMLSADNAEQTNEQTKEKIAGIIANKEQVTDLVWKNIDQTSGSSWKLISSTTGNAQYQLVGTQCAVIFDQPNGMTTNNITSTQTIAEDFSSSFAESINTVSSTNTVDGFTVVKTAPISITLSSPNATKTEFDTYELNADNGTFKGLNASYIRGDYALIVSGVCPKQDVSNLQGAVRSFMQSKEAILQM